jgi:hypothetical protein
MGKRSGGFGFGRLAAQNPRASLRALWAKQSSLARQLNKLDGFVAKGSSP